MLATTGSSSAVFFSAAVVSLAASVVLVSRLERLADRFRLSEAMLGLVVALAADSPEITSSVSASIHGERSIGAGVVLGSNVFNLAALLGLGALVARRIELHRRVVLLEGAVGIWVAVVGVVAIVTGVAAGVSFALLLLAILPYLAVSVRPAIALPRFGVPQRAVTWLTSAISEEEAELRTAIHPNPAGRFDAGLASIALVAVIVASSAMESAGSDLGRHFKLSSLVIGGLVLAAVTSLPNAVAAVYLAAKGRGAAVLSEAMNSNMLNVLFGLLMPALWLGLPSPSRQGDLVAGSYGGLTLLALLLAFAGRGLTRVSGVVILVGYLGFVLAALRV